MQGDPSVFWLNGPNAALGAVVIACCAALLWGVVLEVATRVKARLTSPAAEADDHTFMVPGLGVTMADGGETKDEPDRPEKDA